MAEVNDNSSIQLFEDQKIRTAWDAEKEEWYFSIVDVVAVLTEQKDSRSAAKYWSVLKVRLKNEGSELTTNCSQLKMKAADGKRRLTDVANTEQLLRIIQSIPSKKAEPFKAWLAMVGKERIEETIDPEQAIDRALDTYLKKGYSEEWIHQRLLAIRIHSEPNTKKLEEACPACGCSSVLWACQTRRNHQRRRPCRLRRRRGCQRPYGSGIRWACSVCLAKK